MSIGTQFVTTELPKYPLMKFQSFIKYSSFVFSNKFSKSESEIFEVSKSASSNSKPIVTENIKDDLAIFIVEYESRKVSQINGYRIASNEKIFPDQFFENYRNKEVAVYFFGGNKDTKQLLPQIENQIEKTFGNKECLKEQFVDPFVDKFLINVAMDRDGKIYYCLEKNLF